MRREPDAKWLREMTREVANEPVPDVDWDSVEQRVFDGLDEPGRPLQLSPRTSAWPRVAAIAAIAAGIALAVTWTASDNLPPTAAVHTQAESPAHDGTVVRVGAELVTGQSPLTVEHGDWAQFKLAPQSRVRVQRLDDRVALDLLEGKVEAEVNKHSADEIFTVRVDNMRVAVRGTIFSVQRTGDTLRVEVKRGAVAVGPVSEVPTSKWMISSDSVGTFSLAKQVRLDADQVASSSAMFEQPPDPASTEVQPRQPAPSGSPKVAVAPQPPASAPAVEASLPEKLTQQQAAAQLAHIQQEVESCYRNATPVDNDGLIIHVQTTINVRVAPDGHVSFARFDPPLAPRAQSCASGVVQKARFPRSRQESVWVLSLSL